MTHLSKAVQDMNEDNAAPVVPVVPVAETPVETPKAPYDVHSQLNRVFPHLSLLEKFVLSTVLKEDHIEKLGAKDCPGYFSEPEIAESVNQYISYLQQKDKWEYRKLNDKTQRRTYSL